MNNGVKYMLRLAFIVLFNSELPTRIVMRVRHHKDFQFLTVPLITSVFNHPTLLPRTAIFIQKLNLVIQTLSSYISSGPGNRTILRIPIKGLSGSGETSRGFGFEVGRNGFGDAKEEDGQEEEKKR